MATRLVVIIGYLAFSIGIKAQQVTPQLLKEPAAWEFERFALPPAFSPAFPYKGVEELRFSPGMFKKDSADYFTYAFVAQLDHTKHMGQNEVRDYLLRYFKGLCAGTAKDRKLTIDTTKITVGIAKKKSGPAGETIYNAALHVFGVFADGAPVDLQAEIKVLSGAAADKTWLVFITSPRPKTSKSWEPLYRIQRTFMAP